MDLENQKRDRDFPEIITSVVVIDVDEDGCRRLNVSKVIGFTACSLYEPVIQRLSQVLFPLLTFLSSSK